MPRVAITGASGFIGRELGAALRDCGSDVLELSRSRKEGRHIQWKLGEKLPGDCADADAIVHLASATLLETSSMSEAVELDVEGARLLIEQVRHFRQDGRRHRFIFLSSQSARPEAANAYGRSKWAIEHMLKQADEIVVRPGLVYGAPPASVFATFDKLTKLPIVPIVGSRQGIQPIHVRELADCIVQLVAMDNPPHLVKLGAIQPLTFKDAIRITARRSGRSPPLMIPVPVGPVRLLTRTMDQLLRLNLTERLDGLVSLEPLDTESSLKALGRTLEPFDPSS